MDPATRACSTRDAPLTGGFRRTFLHWSLFFSCWNSHPDTDVRWCPKKNFGFLLLCAKMHMGFERTRLLKDGKKKVRDRTKRYKCKKLQSSQSEDVTELLWSYETWYDPHSNHMIMLFYRTIQKVLRANLICKLFHAFVVRFAVFCYNIDKEFVEPKISSNAVHTIFKK